MDRPILTGVLAVVLLLLAAALLIPGGKAPDDDPLLPWRIELDAAGNSRVFGLTLGKSTLDDARAIFKEVGKVHLFDSSGTDQTVEAYFERINLSGLRADVILTLELAREEAAAMREHGARQEQAGTGTKKITLNADDQGVVSRKPVRLITYMPAAKLDEPLLIARFGEPALRLTDMENTLHLLYPERGLDIALNSEGKALFQYCHPTRFEEILLRPLKQGAAP